MPGNPFATALAQLHGSALAVAAVYVPLGGDPEADAVELTVIHSQPSGDIAFEGQNLSMRTDMVEIMRAAIDQPHPGASLSIGDALAAADVTVWRNFTLQGEPRLDDEGLSWRCPLEPA